MWIIINLSIQNVTDHTTPDGSRCEFWKIQQCHLLYSRCELLEDWGGRVWIIELNTQV